MLTPLQGGLDLVTEWALLVRGIAVVSTVDEVRDEHANSANHNQSNAVYCYRRHVVVRVSVRVCT